MANIVVNEKTEILLDGAMAAEEKLTIINDSKFINNKISCACHMKLSTFFSRRLLRAIALNNTLEIGVTAPRAAEECFSIASACRCYENEISSNRDLADALEKYVSAIKKLKEALE